MTFRPRLATRWKYPPLLCLCALGFWLGLVLFFNTRRGGRFDLALIIGSAAGFVGLARESWRIWTTRVTVDDVGLRWTKGFESHQLRWEEISELGYRREGRRGTRLIVGPVRARSKFLHPLPILPRALYELLKGRTNALPPEVEQELYG